MAPTPREIVARALDIEISKRHALIDALCAGNEELRQSVRELLSMQDSATLASSEQPDSADFKGWRDTPSRAGIHPGAVLDDFRVIKAIGQGAMGIVYLAEQQNPLRRVALKILRHEVLTTTREHRFQFETASLARLRHPGIATIYKSGSVDLDGNAVPFFAMELIDGESLDRRSNYLPLGDQVSMMISICDAVAHAHMRGVVHRDLKPANILVDSSNRPRVLDFGVATSVEAEQINPELVGTVPYMSREQLASDGDVGPQTDIYALGVILCEIMTGKRPHRTAGKSIDEVRKIVATQPSIDRSQVDRDVEAIIRKAISPSLSHRYDSAIALRDDLQQYLDHKPVTAVAGGRLYVGRKFVRRNRAVTALSAGMLLLGIGGFAGVTYQMARATQGWHAAEEQARLTNAALEDATAQERRAGSINRFMINMLTSADPEQTLGEEVTVLEMLDAASGSMSPDMEEQPDVVAGIRMALSNTYRSLGRLADARHHAEEMVRVCMDRLGNNHEMTSDARRTLALVLFDFGEFTEAQRQLDLASPAVTDPAERAKMDGEFARAAHGLGDSETALTLWERSETTLSELLGEHHLETLVLKHNMAMALKDLGRLTESESQMREVLALRTAKFGNEHPQTLVAMDSLAGIIQKQGRDSEAVTMLREALKARQRVLGPDHISTLVSMGNLGVTLIRLGELEEAELLTRAAYTGHRERFGESHTRTMILMGNLAYLLEDLGQISEAAAMYRRSIEIRRAAEGANDPETWSTMNNLGMLLIAGGQPEKAEPLFVELLAMCDTSLPTDHYYTALFRNNYAECLIALGKLEEAQNALNASHGVIEKTFGQDHSRTRKSIARHDQLDQLRSQR